MGAAWEIIRTIGEFPEINGLMIQILKTTVGKRTQTLEL